MEASARKKDALLLKLDITNTFDTVDWAFLLELLAKLGFGHRWITMIHGLLGAMSTRVVVNDISDVSVFYNRGLSQGGPLTSLLFDPVVDVVHLMFERADEDVMVVNTIGEPQEDGVMSTAASFQSVRNQGLIKQ
jgi:hypothetical protein